MKKLWTAAFFLIFVLALPGTAFAEVEERNLPAYLPERIKLEPDEVVELEKSPSQLPVLFSDMEDGRIGGVDPEQNYGYQALLKEGKQYADAYLELARVMEKQEAYAEIDESFTEDECFKILEAVINDFPQFFYVSNGGYQHLGSGGTILAPFYAESVRSDTAAEEFEARAELIIDKSGVQPWMSDYDKALMLHDELAAEITYHEEFSEALKIKNPDQQKQKLDELEELYPTVHTAYGALVEGKAVCDGYAKAYQYLLHKMGILSHVAVGWGNGGGHAWNLVQLDGTWYYTDLTWDDQDEVFYDYFNMDYAGMTESRHELHSYYDMPEPTDTQHNYFVRNGGIITGDTMSLDNIVAQLKENSYARVYIKGDAIDKQKVWDWYQENINEIARKVGITGGYSFGCVSTQREMQLQLYHDTLYPNKNLCVEIGSGSDKTAEVVVGYYDENDVLLEMDTIPCTLQKNTIVSVKAKNPGVKYHKIRYFVWDSLKTSHPIYHSAQITY